MLTQYKSSKCDVVTMAAADLATLPPTLPVSGFDEAEAEIRRWDGYQPTPLQNLVSLATDLNLKAIYYKDEGPRFGLGSFKALGGAYAVLRVLQRELSTIVGREIDIKEIRNGDFAQQISDITVVSATDGNHGRSVAWGAQRFGAKCRIYIHAEVSEFRAEAMLKLGAEVIRVNGDYDASVAQTRYDAEEHGWKIVSDTSWPGYTLAPGDVMAGYGVMAREVVHSLSEPPTHVFLQGGVGGLAAAVTAVFHQEWGANAPHSVVVEPELAPCLLASAKAGTLTSVEIHEETLMAGLSCGEPSRLAWDVLGTSGSSFMSIPDNLVAPTVRMLANGYDKDIAIEAGESAVAGLIGLMCTALNPEQRVQLNLNEASRVLLIGSEGITDPIVYRNIINGRI